MSGMFLQTNGNAFINRLPNEILVQIFLLHVWANQNRRMTIILVCKRWEAIGMCSELWCNIYYGLGDRWNLDYNNPELRQAIKSMVFCSTPESLERAIKRTNSAKFELTIHATAQYLNRIPPLTPNVVRAISQRCRLLRIYNPNDSNDPWTKRPDNSHYQALFNQLAGTPLRKLEEFIYRGSQYQIDASPLLQNLKKNSPYLRSLSAPVFESCEAFPQLLPRILKLVIDDGHKMLCDTAVDKRTFSNLEELSIIGRDEYDWVDLPEYSLPMPALKRVTIETGRLHRLNIKFCTQLTHLQLKNVSRNGMKDPLSLPALVYLKIQNSWPMIEYLHAPNLVTLLLHGPPYTGEWETQGSDVGSLILKLKSFPEVLSIDKVISQKYLTQFLSKFGRNLKELSIYHIKNKTICKELAGILGGSKEQLPICPLLQKLDIITQGFQNLTLYEKTKEMMREMIDIGCPRGVFTQVRHGFYHSWCQEDEDRLWWPIKWNVML